MSLPSVPNAPARLGQNRGSYQGETIRIDAVLEDIRSLASQNGWDCEIIFTKPSVDLLALHRTGTSNPKRRLYVSSGIHGDEPAGPLAIQRLLLEDKWPDDAEFWICPCLNPAGFRSNTRENEDHLDLNRQYLHPEAPAVAAHVRWLAFQPEFDMTVCVHEDWEAHGFYLYELNPDDQPSRATPIIAAVKAVCPIDPSQEIEGRPAAGGIIRPSSDPRSRPQWPEAFHLITHKTRHSYTLEAPSDFALRTRINALMRAIRAALA